MTKLGDYVGFDDRWWFIKRPNCPKAHMFLGKMVLMYFKARRMVLQKKIVTIMLLIL